eukprot:3789364-Heterocapsa_arctica.AAC.1
MAAAAHIDMPLTKTRNVRERGPRGPLLRGRSPAGRRTGRRRCRQSRHREQRCRAPITKWVGSRPKLVQNGLRDGRIQQRRIGRRCSRSEACVPWPPRELGAVPMAARVGQRAQVVLEVGEGRSADEE